MSVRLQAEHVDWDMAAVLSLSREGFGPKGALEVASELLIQGAARGELQAVSQILHSGLVHPDIGDSRGYTALLAATVASLTFTFQLPSAILMLLITVTIPVSANVQN